MTENACRNFLGLIPSNRPSCAMGRDVRAWAIRSNGNSRQGIGLRLPCTKPTGEKTLFDCPELDRETDEEVAERRKAISSKMDQFISILPKLNEMKRKMIENNLPTAVATCPWCGAKDALRVSVAIQYNNHMRAQCTKCDGGIIE